MARFLYTIFFLKDFILYIDFSSNVFKPTLKVVSIANVEIYNESSLRILVSKIGTSEIPENNGSSTIRKMIDIFNKKCIKLVTLGARIL